METKKNYKKPQFEEVKFGMMTLLSGSTEGGQGQQIP